jgi:periplasmic protein TonB
VKQTPQPGDVVAIRARNQGSAAGLHGALLVARRDEPLQSEATDLSNVVPFARPRRRGVVAAFPLPSVAADERPAPHAAKFGVGRGIALVAGSLALHSALLALFWHQPRPMASIGIEVMTIEISLGATTAVGLAPTPSEQEDQAVVPSKERAQDEPVTEQVGATTLMPQDVPVATQETAPETKLEETLPEVPTVEPKPQEQRPEPETSVAESPESTQATEQPSIRTEQPRPQIQTVQRAPERKRTAAPTDTKATQKTKVAAATPSMPSSGLGRGRSDRSSNYDGIVAAHLARYKRTPAAARSTQPGTQGVATVSFSIDGGGRVTSARLVRASGNAAIDQEVVALARRASPFPPPPDGRARSFTIPVRFNSR